MEADVYIVGGGGMGIIVAKTLPECGARDVLLLEAGHDQRKTDPVERNEMEVVSLRPHLAPRSSRTSMIGGPTNCWSGRCMPYVGVGFRWMALVLRRPAVALPHRL